MSVVIAEPRGPVLRVTLNRPERLNAVSEELYAALLEQLAAAEADPRIRRVLLTGAGRAFCVGADLKAQSSDWTAASCPRSSCPTPALMLRPGLRDPGTAGHLLPACARGPP